MYEYKAEVVKWIDGDTVELVIDLGFKLVIHTKARVYGINAPEVHSKDPEEKAAGLKALDFARQLAPTGSTIIARTHKATREEEKFGRWLADITLADGRPFAQTMIENHHAQPYFGGKR